MIKRIVPSLFYSINLNTNEVTRISGKSIESLNQTEDSVRIALYDKKRTVKKEWLKWLVYYNITLPMSVKDEIWNVKFYEQKLKSKLREQDKKVVVFKNPVYVDGNNKFRLLARYPDYAISEDGRLMEVKKKVIRTFNTEKLPKYRYPVITVKDRVTNKAVPVRLHRLVALAWCENTDFISKPIVNHKDRNRHNFNASNLEWISYSGNTIHTDKGRLVYNMTYKVRNINTGEISHIESLTEVSKFIGRSRINTVHTPLKRKYIWEGTNGKFEIKTSIDKSPWLYDKAKDLDNKRLTNQYIVKFVDGTKECYRNRIDLNKAFLDAVGSVESGELIKRILAKRDDIKDIVKIDVSNTNKSGYQAMNINTKDVYYALSHSELSKLIGLSKSTVTKAISIGDAQRVYGDYVMRLYSDEPWDLNDLKIIDNQPISFLVYKNNLLFDKVNSLRKLSKMYNMPRDELMEHFKDSTEYKYNEFNIVKM